VLYTVSRRDGLHPSITRIVYGRNRIRLRWPALSEHHGIPKTSSTTSRGLTDLMTASLSIRHLQMAMTVSAVQLSHKHLTGAQQTSRPVSHFNRMVEMQSFGMSLLAFGNKTLRCGHTCPEARRTDVQAEQLSIFRPVFDASRKQVRKHVIFVWLIQHKSCQLTARCYRARQPLNLTFAFFSYDFCAESIAQNSDE
jgi:hypothetical protein